MVSKTTSRNAPFHAPAPKQPATAARAKRKADPLELIEVRDRIDEVSFVDVFHSDPLTRVKLIKAGLPALYLEQLSRAMNKPKEWLLPALGIAQATVSRKARDSKPLSSDASERALGMARLIGQVQAMVQESGNPEGFNAAQWVSQWLEEPLAALGGQRPVELLDTAEGQAIVSNLLARMQSGAYA